ncbi:MAG TPA: pyridoxal phosphate-dependent aminotransferase [Pirellulales bacterium]|nr:pyridoxal phosphate-dependent aminotransferase [Pirellulales bacterium]
MTMKFSAAVSHVEEAMSIKYNTLVYELKRQGKNVLVMSLGEAYFDLPLLPLDDLPFPDVYHYSHPRGVPELRRKLAGHLAARYDVPIDPEREILVTAGSKAAIQMTLMSILNPADEVLVPEPAWVNYSEQIKLCHARPVGVPWDQGLDAIERYVTADTRAIIVTTPHNPRGYVYREDELSALLALAEKHDLWLLSDEAYSDFVLDGSFTSLGKMDRVKRRSVVFNSISKNLGMSGWRIGYVVGHADLIDQVLKVNQHLITCPATILSHYVALHFERLLEITAPQIRRIADERSVVARHMDEMDLTYLPGAATFYFFVSIEPSRLSSEEFARRLLEDDLISTVPGLGYGKSCDRFIRVSIGTAGREDNLRGIRRIKALIEATC